MTINQQDFITPLTGNVIVYNNFARIVLQANTDLNPEFEGDESFKLLLRRGSNVGPVVTTSEPILLSDTSNIKSYTIVSNLPAEAMADTANVRFTVNTINVSSGDTLYYYTTGNVTTDNFVEGNTGTFNVSVIQGLGAANIVLTATDIPANTTAVFQLVISESPLGNAVATSNTVSILDIALTQLNATGGAITTSGGFRTHVFTTSGTFTVAQTGLNPTPVSFLVVAGGGGGGSASPPAQNGGGGGGAGGFRPSTTTIPNSISPSTPYTITVGGGGAVFAGGGNSSALGITSTGGGRGARSISLPTDRVATPGGSGGGGNRNTPANYTAGSGTPGQGNPGGSSTTTRSEGGFGGGGAGGAGGGSVAPPGPVQYRGTDGGIGAVSPISPPSYGTPGPSPGRWFAGGGGGGTTGFPPSGLGNPGTPTPAAGGGGAGGHHASPGGLAPTHIAATSGGTNTGGGGGGAYAAPFPSSINGGTGGSGIVIIRYPYT